MPLKLSDEFDDLFQHKAGMTQKYDSLDPRIINEYNKKRYLGAKPLLCYAPSKNLRFSIGGKVIACCHNNKDVLGLYPKQTIKEIWNGQVVNELRDRIKHNDLTSGCKVCETDFKNKCFDSAKTSLYDKFPLNKEYPTMMDFKLENTCNLECIMCFGRSSSSIRKNREQLPPIIGPYDDKFVQQLEEFIPYLADARFSGGEPFLIDLYYTIWDRIIELNPECSITIQTNATILNDRVRNMLKRGKFQFNISIDSVNKNNYERIRVNADFNKVMNNIKFFRQYCRERDTFFGTTCCVTRENWKELPDFINFCNRIESHVWFSIAYAPPKHALWTLNSKQLNEIYDTLASVEFHADSELHKQNWKYLADLLELISVWRKNAIERENSEDIETVTLKNLLLEKAKLHLDDTEENERLSHFIIKLDNVFKRFAKNDSFKSGVQSLEELFSSRLMIEILESEPEESFYENIKSILGH